MLAHQKPEHDEPPDEHGKGQRALHGSARDETTTRTSRQTGAELGGRPEIHLGSGPDARLERSVTRARRMSRPAKAGATDEVRPPRRRLCARPVQHAEG